MKYLFIAILLISCERFPQINQETQVENVKKTITYFKDENTGLCYAAVNSRDYHGYLTTSITCVPCDSLKKVKLK